MQRLLNEHAGKSVLIVCSGSMGSPNLEDMYGAGYLVDLLVDAMGADGDTFSDASLAARAVFRAEPAEQALLRSRVGRMMIERALQHEVRFASQLGVLDVVPELKDGRLTA